MNSRSTASAWKVHLARASLLCYRYAEVLEDLNELVDIAYIRDVINDNFFVCQQDCTENLQRLVLRTLRDDFTTEFFASVDLECAHRDIREGVV